MLTTTSVVYTIQVSGYPAITAAAVMVNDRMIGTMAGSADLALTRNLGAMWHHCPGCNAAIRPTHARGGSLGYPMCAKCDETWKHACLTLVGRLPRPEEFFCRGCNRLQSRENLCNQDPDGRRRWRCKPCRRAQGYRAEQRRRWGN